MKRANDVARVLKGLSHVIDQVLANSKSYTPELQRKTERLHSHASQLVRAIIDYRYDDNIINKDPKESNVYESTHTEPIIPKPPTANPPPSTQTSYDINQPKEFIINGNPIDLKVDAAPIQDQKPDSPAAKHSRPMTQAEIDLIRFPSDHTPKASSSSSTDNTENIEPEAPKVTMKARAVPSSQIARMWGFGSLAAQMAFGAATESASRFLDGGSSSQSISDRNAERLAEALCRMRGAALKLGQMLSLHDADSLPPALSKALERVRQGADYMPRHQLEDQLIKQLGSAWRDNFVEFNDIPIAAASIGQVHKGKLLDGTDVAVKIQYPGVAESIESDLHNLKRLVNMTNLLPPGLFIDQIIKVATEELANECDYISEAASQMKYRELVAADPILRKHVNVPQVYTSLSTSRVLTTALVDGISIEKAASLPQGVKNAIARTTLITTMRELFDWRLVQSDPNYGNYLYDDPKRTINMIDFGATRKYRKAFIDGYIKLVWAAANKDRDTLISISKELGFLTGDESAEMLYAHAETGLVVGEPFLSDEPYDFAASNLSARISKYGGTFMKYRLTAPPTETYSLHRKLAGAFLLCIRLKAKIPCRDILEDTYKSYKF